MNKPTPRTSTGEGSCTVINGRDGYYYAYCFRNHPPADIVARALIADPGVGKWMKYFKGKWDQPALGGDATGLAQGVSGNAAQWDTFGETLLLDWTKGGIGLQFSADKIKFTSLREPLSVLDPGTWARPAASELIAYHVLLDAKTGTNQLSNAWLMAYMYIQPNEGFDKRYLVIRSVTVTVSNSPVNPQVGVLLARWYNAKLHDHWSTTAPAPPDGGSVYQLEAKSGYLLTRADPTKATVELEDCVSH